MALSTSLLYKPFLVLWKWLSFNMAFVLGNDEKNAGSSTSTSTHLSMLHFPDTISEPLSSSGGSGCSPVCEKTKTKNKKKKYDVFISHRGPDTKLTLGYHLYDVLQARGVSTFLDKEEMERGKQFTEDIKSAIACCRVQICIISVGYAESEWCLRELKMMMDKHDNDSNGSILLIPVFYGVTPSHVRYLKGDFGAGFRKLSKRSSTRFSQDMLHQWRNALHKVATVTGYEGKGELCMTIVNKVCQKLDVGYLATPAKILGIEKQLISVKEDVMRRCQEGLGVTSVEISGMGGIGKTTFAKCLYNQIYSQFERYCFIEDVNGLVEKEGINAVHSKLISNLFGYHPCLSKSEGKQFLKERLYNSRILVVFDNINKDNCLSAVFIEDDVLLDPHSIIIVTSREIGVLTHDPMAAKYCENVISLQIAKLGFVESKQIFCEYAFGGIEYEKREFHDLTNKMVKKCDGIPLALALLGRQVYRRDIQFWENFWNAIKDSLPPGVKKILKVSYDGLDEPEKRLFIDVAIFFPGEKFDLLNQLLQRDEDDGSVFVAIHNLQLKLLIDVEHGFLKMHDLLVDLARTIVKSESSCPGRRSRVWDRSDIKDMLSNKTGTEKVKGLSLISKGSVVLDEDENGDPCAWSFDAFSELSSLEFLILDGHCIEGDLSMLPKRLLWLKWTNFPYENISQELCLKCLRVLDLSGEVLKLLWVHPLKEAPVNLRQLLVNCINLESLPEFNKKFRYLSSLELSGCKSLEVIPESFALLQGLKHLKLYHCGALKLLPRKFGELRSLAQLEMEGCPRIKCLPKSFGQLTKLEFLDIALFHGLEELPDSVGGLKNLLELHLSVCDNLRFLPESLGNLLRLEQFHLFGLCALEGLPKSTGNLRNLKRFTVRWCDNVRYTPESFQALLSIQNVCIGNTYSRSEFRDYSAGLGQIVPVQGPNIIQDTLELSDLEHVAWHFTQLPQPMMSSLSGRMRSLKLHGCCNLSELPESVGSFPHLEILQFGDFYNLQKLPESMMGLSSLRVLKLDSCLSLQQLPTCIGKLSFLETLHLRSCWDLRKLPSNIGNLETLRELHIKDCPVLKGLPSCLGNLPSLQDMVVGDCWMVEIIYIQGLFNLKSIRIYRCVNLRSIVGLAGLTKLAKVAIEGCLNLRQTRVTGISANVKSSSSSSLEYVSTQGCYQIPIPDGLLAQPEKLREIRLSLNDDLPSQYDMISKTISAVLKKPLNSTMDGTQEFVKLSAKVSPAVSVRLEQSLSSFLSGTDASFFSFHAQFSDDDQIFTCPINSEDGELVIICFLSAVYSDHHLFPSHMAPPTTTFHFKDVRKYQSPSLEQQQQQPADIPATFQQFDFGEEIHLGIFPSHVFGHDGISICAQKTRNCPKHVVFIEKGWIIFLGGGEKQNEMAAEISKIFLSELRRYHTLSRAWTNMPSQLSLFEFSALDVAGCQITKISRCCDAFIMEQEETGLTWKRRRWLFGDDHALLQMGSKFSYLEALLANIYEISVSILIRGWAVRSRKVRQNVPINEVVSSPLYNLLQRRAVDSIADTMEIMKRKRRSRLWEGGHRQIISFDA